MNGYFIGLMSGTSADGVDAALVEFSPAPRLLASHFLSYPPPLQQQLLHFAAGHYQGDAVDQLGALDTELGGLFAEAALAVISKGEISKSDISAIGSHGQTVRHRPKGKHPFTLQIADPNIITACTGLTTVADFRRRDVAQGGEGAPLVPAFHHAVFSAIGEHRAVVNVGGIANITLLPAGGNAVSGFDTGPGNVLMDAWSRSCLRQPYDANGVFAASGKVDAVLLDALLADAYFHRPPPKSTGREHFSETWLTEKLATRKLPAADVMATLCELTARSIADAIQRQAPQTMSVLICGGGAHNAQLGKRLTGYLPHCMLSTTEAFGVHPDWVEAVAFAWLARETLAGRPGNLPSVTGAQRPVVLGGIYPA
ncbi:MAG: anhydro-N-acetylmuramic acid kinase [Gammaproteobacteria bacterium]|nr:anhydro-N-acetylmuramic acid kinase [Gammaproteobacteria bacterium]